MTKIKKVAVIGTQGVPAHYGGFESLVENLIGENCSENVEYTVFCSRKDFQKHPKVYKNAKLRYCTFHANGKESVPYDILSMLKSIWHGYDVALILGTSGCLFIPIFKLFFRGKIIVNIDGMEHRRAKWSGFAKRFLLVSEAMAFRFATTIIADNKAIADYAVKTYGKTPVVIAYGGDHVFRNLSEDAQKAILSKYGVEPDGYAMSVCRIVPENNCHKILEAYAAEGQPLIFVGNWKSCNYAINLRQEYENYPNIIFINSEYDLDILYTLRKNAKVYVHGHSAGGTNPSLVEAMHFGKPICAYDVVFNRETTKNAAQFFKTINDLRSIIRQGINPQIGTNLKEIATKEYTWKKIASMYEDLY